MNRQLHVLPYEAILNIKTPQIDRNYVTEISSLCVALIKIVVKCIYNTLSPVTKALSITTVFQRILQMSLAL